MASSPFQVLLIDEKLRNTLAQLQAFLGVRFDQAEIEQVFIDAETDQVSFKTYSFYRTSSFWNAAWTITGAVDEYEPETLFLKSSGGIGKRKKFDLFFANYCNS
ncbi:hypothetical protein [Hymenobacter cellulosivorans]|uniref:Uncharacterized protein n=1 Tax=Hymenobacter cellulosivorans TaxID=2932249 RepID=A0ABY4F7K4_9BACT|nr:hypothetical protein [Hymenobacter cellulosivorans]UOQ51899.1 hypothetical protein MUN80_19305 [Hymenobacter cellulosivorans]